MSDSAIVVLILIVVIVVGVLYISRTEDDATHSDEWGDR